MYMPDRLVVDPRDQVDAVTLMEARQPQDGRDSVDIIGNQRPDAHRLSLRHRHSDDPTSTISV